MKSLLAILLTASLASAAPDGDSCGKCGNKQYGTSVAWAGTPSDAAAKAKADEKLVFVLHVSGHFEDPKFTWNNAQALRVNALANPEVGAYINKHFVSSFQKVATFQIVNGQKQGGNVASYFCAPDGRVLHCVAGPVDAGTMLREARWVVESVKKAMEESRKTEVPFKALFRRWHAERLRQEHGLVVEPATFDAPSPREDDPLTYNDPTGRPVLPVLVLPPIDGPDVEFRAKAVAAEAADAAGVPARKGGRWALGNQGRVHQLMSAYSMIKIEKVYATVFQNILGERVSTRPVITINARDGERKTVCLTCESKAHAD